MNMFNKKARIGISCVMVTLTSVVIQAEESIEYSGSLVIDSTQFSVPNQLKKNVTRALADLSVQYTAGDWILYANSQAKQGSNASDYIGDIQAFSNVDEDDFARIYQAWAEYHYSDTTRIKVGQIDMNTEFAFADNAGEFINASMGFSPTIFTFATYPTPAAGLVVTHAINDDNEVAVSINSSDHPRDFNELSYIFEWRGRIGQSIVKLGTWYTSGHFEQLHTGNTQSGINGFHAVIEGNAKDDVGYFVQLGYTPGHVSEIEKHFGAGVTFENTGIHNVTAGVGLTTAWLSDSLHSAKGKETSIEFYANWQLSDNLSLKPDLQYIISPSGEDRNEVVATLRVSAGF